jgi:hypothetical protein
MTERAIDEMIEELEFLERYAAGNPAYQITDYDAYCKACKRHGLTPVEERS